MRIKTVQTKNFIFSKTKKMNVFCEKLSIHDARKINVSEPKTEREMRFLCADIGEKVCGICIAELYGDYD